MADEIKNNDEELEELEIAELANKEIKKRDADIAQLKRELAKAKLYSEAEDDEPELMSREDCIKAITSNRTSNYDYARAVVDLRKHELDENGVDILGEQGEAVSEFFQECIDDCDGDKSRFVAVYQAKIGPDDPQIAKAYSFRKNKK